MLYDDETHFNPYDPSQWTASSEQPWNPVSDNYSAPSPSNSPFPNPNDNAPAWVKAIVGVVLGEQVYDNIADSMGWPRLNPLDNNTPTPIIDPTNPQLNPGDPSQFVPYP